MYSVTCDCICWGLGHHYNEHCCRQTSVSWCRSLGICLVGGGRDNVPKDVPVLIPGIRGYVGYMAKGNQGIKIGALP